jgi:hypothetical protein
MVMVNEYEEDMIEISTDRETIIVTSEEARELARELERYL